MTRLFKLLTFFLLMGATSVHAQDEFITTWQTTTASESITIPTNSSSYTYNYEVDWGDGSVVETGIIGDATHTYTTAGEYTVQISGTFPAIYFNNTSGDKDKILTVAQWGIIAWEDMTGAFYGCSNLHVTATDAPDLSNVTMLNSMFRNASSFNASLNHWDVSNIQSMNHLFRATSLFNGEISNWNTSNVTSMKSTFMNASAFNQDISNWNVSKVASMQKMFRSVNVFNQDITGWDVSANQDFEEMFRAASAFDQNLGDWDISSANTINDMLKTSGLSLTNYDSTLIGWSALSLPTGLTLGASGLTYCQAAIERQSIIDSYSWTINDAGQKCVFVTTWQTTTANESITIPTNSSYTYNYDINWGDGSTETGLTSDATHSYTTADTFTVEISGTFPAIYFNNSGDKDKILTIEQWSNIEWETMENAFYGCNNLTYNAPDAPDLSNVSSLYQTFRAASSFNGNIDSWNVSTITNMQGLFRNCSSFNQDLNSWDVSKVTSMRETFAYTDVFNGNITNWNVSSLTNMSGTFTHALVFNQNIGSWNVSNVNTLFFTFSYMDEFDQDLNDWDVSKVFYFTSTFRNTTDFNGNISNWDVTGGDETKGMFANAKSFNQDISNWNVENMTSLQSMFANATSFDQNLSNWDLSNITNVTSMLNKSGLSTTNYDLTLLGWSNQTLQSSLSLGASSLTYCLASEARQKIIDDFGWSISDGGESCTADMTIWDGSSWDNGTPTSIKVAVISDHYNTYTDGAFTADTLWILTNDTLVISGDSSVTVNNEFYNYGNITLQDTSSFIQTASNPNNLGNGTYAVEREGYYHYWMYNYWSSPVQNTTIDQVFGTNGKDFYDYDASTQSWATADQNTVLAAGYGFTATGKGSNPTTAIRTFSDNTGFNSGTITISPAFDGTAGVSANNWNLIGNPYPSGLDVNQFLSDNVGVIESAVYLWSSDGDDEGGLSSDYATMNTLGVVNAGGSGIEPRSATISSTQGFFVQTLASGDISFNNSQRLSTNNTFQRATTLGQRIWLSVAVEGGASNEILLGFMADGDMEQDRYDASKLIGNSQLALYSYRPCTDASSISCSVEGERKLAIQGLPELTEDMIVPLGLQAKIDGIFTFNISNLAGFSEATSIYLYDVLTEELIDLRSQNYTVDLSSADYANRFFLQFTPSRVTSVAELEKGNEVNIFSYRDQIHIQFENEQAAKAEIMIYDLMGRVITRQTNQHDLQRSFHLTQTGVYIVRVHNAKGMLTRKVIIH